MDVNDFLILMLEKGGKMNQIPWSQLILIALIAGAIGGLLRYHTDNLTLKPAIPVGAKWRLMQYVLIALAASGFAVLLDRIFDSHEGKFLLCAAAGYTLAIVLNSMPGQKHYEAINPGIGRSEMVNMTDELINRESQNPPN